MPMPSEPKIYHIVHVDRLASIITDGFLWCDATMQHQERPGTTIGMGTIKQRRLTNPVKCRPGLHVGDCVPFYFCPRSVMLYVIHKRDHQDLTYHDGQRPIVHLEADLQKAAAWAGQNKRRWAFTLSNAGSTYFEDRCDLAQLQGIDWKAVGAGQWQNCKDRKQVEFLVEGSFPWTLVQRIGVCCEGARRQAQCTLVMALHKPPIQIQKRWYY